MKYDTDESGTLDREECKNFVHDLMKEIEGVDSMQFCETTFNQIFNTIDKDRSNTIDKQEMV